MSASRPIPEPSLTSLAALGLDAPAAAELVAVMTPVELRRGHVLFRQGDDGASLYVVQSGILKLSQRTREARTSIQALFGPGDMFGEMSVLGGGQRSGTVVAVTPSRVLELPPSRFDQWLAERPWMAGVLLRHLAQRLRTSNDVVADLVFADVPSRVARVVLRLAERFGAPQPDGSLLVDHQLTQDELAQLVGAARESVNKALAALAGRGYIELRPRAVRIIEPGRLEAFSR